MRALDPELSLKAKGAFFILMKACEFDAKVEVTDPDPASNPTETRPAI